MTFAQIVDLVLQIYVSTIVAESVCQFVDFGQFELTDFTESRLVYDGHRRRLLFYSFRLCFHPARRCQNMFDILSQFYTFFCPPPRKHPNALGSFFLCSSEHRVATSTAAVIYCTSVFLSSVIHLLAMRHVFLCEFVVFGTF